MSKNALVERLHTLLRTELESAERVARETAAAANHPEASPENDKDTRKVELSYLAAGQAARAREIEASIALLGAVPLRVFRPDAPLSAGALVTLDTQGRIQRVFLLPAGGGMKVADDRGEISVVTPQSPIGRGLLGKTVGESFELSVAGKRTEVEILDVE